MARQPQDEAAREEDTLLADEDQATDQSDLAEERRQKPSIVEPLLTVVYCVAYLLVGPALILTNKQILKDIGFGYPMMVSGIGQASSAIGAAVVIRVLRLQPLTQAHQVRWSFFVRNMGVVGAATAASLCFGNAGYLYLTVSFVQILKAFTPVFVVAMLFCTGVETPSKRVCFAVLMICVGTSIASAGEAHFDALGLLIMLCAETCEAIRLVLTQKLLNNLKFPAMEGLYYMAPICTIWMWGLASVIELPTVLRNGHFALVQLHPFTFFWAMFLGFAVNVASFLVIKRTSSVMLKLMGTARNAGLVLFSAIFLEETITTTQAFGYGVCLFFFCLYNYYKLNHL
ncbi:hypothetical protein AB1Y20_009713 [Prymnesium parvum]|uniref:Sugar phosphate transporter domain-containing protein n=1 Tax=Prymnesium parvum TaxID=97485 RepID=A0AB34K2D9_PRYPA